eukprot:EG_transcript_1461
MEFRISFTFVLTLVTLALSLVPAIIIWVVFMDLMTSSVDLLKSTTRDSMDVVVQNIVQLLMSEAIEQFDARLSEGEMEMTEVSLMVQGSGVLAYDLHPSRFDIPRLGLAPFTGQTFTMMKGHPVFSQVALIGCFLDPTESFFIPTFWVTWVALFYDLNNTYGTHTLYSTPLMMARNEKVSTLNISQVDQITGKPVRLLSNQTAPAAYFKVPKWVNGWLTTMAFNRFTGQVALVRRQRFPAQNGTWILLTINIAAATLSDELRSQLDGFPQDRLVLFFRQPHGFMIASSHGKYFSHSDVDPRYINPLLNPINVSAYSLWTCLQSDDALIAEACQQLYSKYQSWTAIPESTNEAVLSGQQYWVATGYSTGSLQCTVLMLKNRASVMGSIDASNGHVDQSMSDKKGVTFAILGVVSALAVVLPLSVGLWLAARLYTLARGMDHIAQSQFATTATKPTLFQELHRFQASFVQMERGLRAFGKFVPQAVVKVLIAGKMANDEMYPRTLTVMFADIEGFSAICEAEFPAVLVAVCTEYFEAMCSNIVQHNGTIDKFIGDCIMALWNAPEALPNHEKDAVAASLAMQDCVMGLHESWRARGLPVLKFRTGIHTGECLVGNFGCSYRVSYTCLGDGVNLSSRLEGLNKKFGTYICVSGSTYQACAEDFHFRRLGQVTVPGKAEVLLVFEVLCKAEHTEKHSLEAVQLPGAASLDMEDVEHPRVMYKPAKLPTVGTSLELCSPGQVAYHWTQVDRTALLQSAARYEEAYTATVAGDPQRARQLLAANQLLDPPDKAWAALAAQLEHAQADRPWDGVFHFREK